MHRGSVQAEAVAAVGPLYGATLLWYFILQTSTASTSGETSCTGSVPRHTFELF